MKGLPHPERFDESISILLQALPDVSDAYGALVRAVRHQSDSQILSLAEQATDRPQTMNASSTNLFRSDPRARLVAVLIEMDYAAAAILLRLEERLPKPREATKFSVAALVSRYLKENGLTALEGRAMVLVNDIWTQRESSQV